VGNSSSWRSLKRISISPSASWICRRSLLLKALDGGTQPISQGLLQPELIRLQHVHRIPLWVQRNMMTRYVFALRSLGNEVGETTFAAGMRPRRLAEIDAGERILEDSSGGLGRTNRTSIASLLQEREFELENFQNIALVIGHDSLPFALIHALFLRLIHPRPVTVVTGLSDVAQATAWQKRSLTISDRTDYLLCLMLVEVVS